MVVRIVTDSLSDITGDLTEELGIDVVPLYVRFGEKVYRDRVDMTTGEFYRKLVQEATLPTTTQPPPGDLLNVFNKLAKETDEILVIVVSSKLSGTYQSALQAKNLMEGKCRIEIIDSLTVAMGLGLVVINAAKTAQAGASLDELVDSVHKTMSRSHLIIFFDTLQYLARGGRIGKAQGFLGSLLSVKPILTIKDGEMAPLTRVRSKSAGMEYLRKFVAGFSGIERLAVEYATTPDDADSLIGSVSSVFSKERIFRSVISPVLGTYAGPNAIAVSVLEVESE